MDGDAGQGGIGAEVVGPLAVSHRLAEEGARLRAAGPDAVDAVFESSFRALSADEFGQLGGCWMQSWPRSGGMVRARVGSRAVDGVVLM
jgi:hypothetical protein